MSSVSVPASEIATAQPLRVYIIARSTLERRALRHLMEGGRGLVVVGEAETYAEALAEIARLQPQVVLLEASLPSPDGLLMVPRITELSPTSRIILLVDDQTGDGLFRVAGLGVWGYLSKNFALEESMRAVQLVGQGAAVLSCTVSPEAFQRLSALARPPVLVGVRLSLKETAVIRVIAAGATDRQIAAALDIAVPTVKTYVRSILKKTKTHNRAEAVAFSLRNGLIT